MALTLGSLARAALPIAGGALFGPLGAVGGSAIAGALKKRPRPGAAAGPVGPTTDSRLTGAVETAGGQAFRDKGYEGLTGFDPGAAYKEYLGGAEEAFGRQLGEGLDAVRGTEVGRGRLDSGFGALDETDFARQLTSDYRREASSKALDASGMNLSRLNSIAGIEEGKTGTYLDLLTGQKDREQAAANAKSERKANRRNAIIGGIGQIAGAAAGAYLGRR